MVSSFHVLQLTFCKHFPSPGAINEYAFKTNTGWKVTKNAGCLETKAQRSSFFTTQITNYISVAQFKARKQGIESFTHPIETVPDFMPHRHVADARHTLAHIGVTNIRIPLLNSGEHRQGTRLHSAKEVRNVHVAEYIILVAVLKRN